MECPECLLSLGCLGLCGVPGVPSVPAGSPLHSHGCVATASRGADAVVPIHIPLEAKNCHHGQRGHPCGHRHRLV